MSIPFLLSRLATRVVQVGSMIVYPRAPQELLEPLEHDADRMTSRPSYPFVHVCADSYVVCISTPRKDLLMREEYRQAGSLTRAPRATAHSRIEASCATSGNVPGGCAGCLKASLRVPRAAVTAHGPRRGVGGFWRWEGCLSVINETSARAQAEVSAGWSGMGRYNEYLHGYPSNGLALCMCITWLRGGEWRLSRGSVRWTYARCVRPTCEQRWGRDTANGAREETVVLGLGSGSCIA